VGAAPGRGEGYPAPCRLRVRVVLEARIEVRIETPFRYGSAGDGRRYEPSDSRSLAPLLGLHQATVTSAEKGEDGTPRWPSPVSAS
jgi:hypothetical protein